MKLICSEALMDSHCTIVNVPSQLYFLGFLAHTTLFPASPTVS